MIIKENTSILLRYSGIYDLKIMGWRNVCLLDIYQHERVKLFSMLNKFMNRKKKIINF